MASWLVAIQQQLHRTASRDSGNYDVDEGDSASLNLAYFE